MRTTGPHVEHTINDFAHHGPPDFLHRMACEKHVRSVQRRCNEEEQRRQLRTINPDIDKTHVVRQRLSNDEGPFLGDLVPCPTNNAVKIVLL